MLLALVVAAAVPTAAFTLDTVATRSGYTKTGRLDEVAAVCAAVNAHGGARCAVKGTSPEGRPITAITVGDPRKQPTLLVIGGIHAGEIDGKDAGFLVLSEILDHKLAVDGVAVVFVPVFNVDGHERFARNHRPNQRGPEEMGWRVNAQNLNLNRDWTKADAPETRALLGLIEEVDPVVVVDLHVTDGAQFQHDISVVVEPQNDDGSDGALVAPAKKLSASLQQALTAKGHQPLDFYPSFEHEGDPTSGIAVGVTPARLTHGYAARRGRIGVLVETHSWRSYRERVMSTADLLRGLLAVAKTDAASWKKAAVDVDNARAALPGKRVVVAWDTDRAKRSTFAFQGYAYSRTPSDVSGGLWTRYDEKQKQVWDIPLWGSVKPAVTTTAPLAYAVLPGWAPAVAERLRAHGITFTTTTTARDVDGETFKASAVTFSPRPYEGRMTARATGSWTKTPPKTTLPPGSLLVPVGQPRGRLVVELFEPQAPESLCGWGFFNAVFEQKEYMEDYVIEAEARSMMAKDPALKKAFEERLASDPAFAKDSAARLDFFYTKHPAWDERKDVLPVLRLNAL
jgi:hypothetical protein